MVERPDSGEALAAGFAHYRDGDIDRAQAAFARAAEIDERSAGAQLGLGLALAASGRVAESLDRFETALELDPRSLDAARCLAQAALRVDELTRAERALDRALALAPDDAHLHAMHAETLASTGRYARALAAAERWRTLAPGDGAAHRAAGEIALELGRHDAALEAFRRACALDSDDIEAVRGLAAALEPARFDGDDLTAGSELVKCLRTPGVDTQRLARAAGDLVCARYGVSRSSTERPLTAWAEAGWTDDPLVLALLERAINVDPKLERVFAAQRAVLVRALAADGEIPAGWRAFAAALAVQACAGEHVWPKSADEDAGAVAGAARLASFDIAGETPVALTDSLTAAALYAPPHRLANATAVAAAANAIIHAGLLVRRALSEPLEEREMGEQIQRSAPSDETSLAVQAQYEESPYPRWVELPPHREEPAPEQLRWAHPAFERAPCFDAPYGVLVAGCGTGRHPLRVARRERESEVTAIDLSVASLAHARRKARELGIRNIRFRQLDILDAHELEDRFAIVESFGVLHHMRDPAAGLRCLAERLEPGGVIKLGLYSRRARRAVNAARERIAALRIGQSPDAVRAFRARILAGREPALESLLGSTDFYSTSACRDLLFHVQELQYSPLGLRALLDGAALRFLGFQLRNRQIEKRYRERFPHDGDMTDLANWERFEEEFPDTFPNTLEFWSQKPS